MTARPPGTVFSYPYLWVVEKDRGLAEAKGRTTCLLTALPAVHASGQAFERLVLLGITDTVFQGQAALEIRRRRSAAPASPPSDPPSSCCPRPTRTSFRAPGTMAPGDPTFGTFSAKFLADVLVAFKAVVRSRRLRMVSRQA